MVETETVHQMLHEDYLNVFCILYASVHTVFSPHNKPEK